jgi:hypothetical protein
MNRSKAIGTAAETAVVRAARARGFPWADRYALHGRNDIGDVFLCPGVIVEIKGGDWARKASDALIEDWLAETERERINAQAPVGFLVVQRAAVGAANAQRWSAWWLLRNLMELVPHMGIPPALHELPVRLSLETSLLMLRSAGYGTPLDEQWLAH